MIKYSNYTLTKSEREKVFISSKANNIFYTFFFINKNARDSLLILLNNLELENINQKTSIRIANSILDSYISYLKQRMYSTLSFEYNLLKKEGILMGDFSDFITDYTNNKDWIEYFFTKYPILNDITNKVIENSKRFTIKILTDFDEDYILIKKEFNVNIQMLQYIDISLGDMHNNMQTVSKLVFENKCIYYKPRSLKNEKFIYSFMKFLELNGLNKSMIYPKTITVKNRGWMEEIIYQNVNNHDDLSSFFFNQGVNLCIFYFLGVSDLIADNIIANGRYPCYFDLECILTPFLEGVNNNNEMQSPISTSNKFILTSVLSTSLLPELSFTKDDFQGINISGLSFVEGQIPTHRISAKDEYFERKYAEIDFNHPNIHIPKLGEKKINQVNKVENIKKGFILAYEFTQKNKEKILNYLLVNGLEINTRFLYRPTHSYSKLLEESELPIYLNSKSKRKGLFKNLDEAKNIFLNNYEVINSEYNQIKNLDVPMFYAKSNNTSVYSNNLELIQNSFFSQTGLDLVIEKLSNSSIKNMKSQLNLIEISFCLYEGYPIKNRVIKGKYFDFSKKNEIVSNKNNIRTKIRQTIYDIIQKLETKSIQDEKNNSFYDLVQTPNSTWGLTSVSWGLFDGLDGYAFFYLNYYLVYNDSVVLKKGVNNINQGIIHFGQFKSYYDKIEGFNKVSLMNFPISTFYIAEIYLENGIEIDALNDNEIKNILKWITDFYQEDFDYDMLSGGAGTIIYLLKLYKRIKKEEVLELAVKIAERLINESNKEGETIFWISKYKKSHTGFSHGSSGFSYVFAKLASFLLEKSNSKTNLLKSMNQAMNYERQLFDKEKKYWYFSRIFDGNNNEIDKTEKHYWAYGSGSIAQSRLLISNYYNDEVIIDELKTAIENLKKNGAFENLNYSSGVFGNLDLLNEFSTKNNDINLKNNILDYLELLLTYETDDELVNLELACSPIGFKTTSYYEMNGFFTGITGIGNVLLNIYDYDKTTKLFD